jgi:TolB-like protein/Tfp pilus assembly protein PilF
MAKCPEDRYQRVDEMLADLNSLRKQFESGATEQVSISARSVRRRKAVFYAGLATLLVLILAAGLFVWQWNEKTSPQVTSQIALDKNRLVVLPFTNLRADEEDEYFADGMTEELISTLSKIGGLRVIARTSSMRYKGAGKSIHEIGRELNVGTIIEGSVRKSARSLRVVVQLIEVQTRELIWSQIYHRELEDIFDIQSDIASQVAHALKVQFMEGKSPKFAIASTKNLEAYNLYLKGRYFWNKRTKAGFEQAIEYFEQAIKIDSAYAPAYAGLADCYFLLANHGYHLPKEAMPKAKTAAMKALEIDDTLAEAHSSLAGFIHMFDWNLPAAESEYQRAVAFNPSYATAHQWYALLLAQMGRLDESIVESKRAQELDPLSLVINSVAGRMLHFGRQYNHAIEQYLETLELDPSFWIAHAFLAQTYVQKQRYEDAIAEFQKAIDFSGGQLAVTAMLGHAYAVSGKKDEAQKVLDELIKLSQQEYALSYFIAMIYTGLGEKDQAFEWLQKAYEERSDFLLDLNITPVFDSLHSDPRFIELLKKVGLEN